VLLASSNGAVVNLRIHGYQYPRHAPVAGEERDWDANWLVIHADVRPVEGFAWSFANACMTTWEAGHLVDWLREVADDDTPGGAAGDEPRSRFSLLEPVLTFEAHGWHGQEVAVTVVFDHEGSPAQPETPREHRACRVRCLLTREQLHGAAEDWLRELLHHPAR